MDVKDHDPDRDRAALKKLQRQVKEEEKGAMRELAKDALYLQQQWRQKRSEEEEERSANYQRIMRELEEQQHMAKTLDRSRDRLTKKLKAAKEKAKKK